MIIDRYIARTVTSGTLLAAVILLLVFAFVDFVGQMDNVGQGDYTAVRAMLYVLLLLPQRLYELSPPIILLGGMMSLGALAASSELIVMRASGISTSRITRSVLLTGSVIAIFVALLGEYVVPETTSTAKTLRAEAIEKKLILGGYNDIWARDGNRYVNVKHVFPDHRLQQINIYELDEKRRLHSITYARQASYIDNQWVVKGIRKTVITSQSDKHSLPGTEVSFEKQRIMPRLILLELFSVLELDAKDMSASELYTYSRYLDDNSLDSGEYRLAFWIKIFTPFTCLAMLLVAMPLVFTTTPRSGGTGQRIVLAVIIGIVFFVISRTTNYLGLATGVLPVISAAAPLVFIYIISLLLLRSVR